MGPCTRGRGGGARRGGTGRARLWYCFAGEKLRIASTVSLHQENVPLSKANHFVVGEPVGSHGSGEAASWCDAFYLSLGRRVRETIADGDCALDALCIVSGADRTLPSRNALRVELSNVLLGRLGDPQMEETFKLCREMEARRSGAHAPAVAGGPPCRGGR